MTFITQPKKEGETIECPNCKDIIIARLKEYKDFPSKIQWQDHDKTKAHFDKDGNCKGMQSQTTTVETNTSDGFDTPVTAPEKQTLPEISPELKANIEGDELLLLQIRKVVTDFAGKFEINPHPGMISNHTDIHFKKFCQSNFQKASEIK